MKPKSMLKFFLYAVLFFLMLSDKSVAQESADKVLQKVYNKLTQSKTISYTYIRNINYFSENYHSEIKGNAFIDFKSNDKILGFKFQLNNEQSKVIFNGTQLFNLDNKEKTIEISHQPNLNNFSSLSLFFNSIITLKKVLPAIIADREITKTLRDTTINNKNLYLASFILQNKTINSLGGFTPTTVKINFDYKILIDQESLLPLYVIQANNIQPKDYTKTSFSNIEIDGAYPDELSWYYSTYLKDYKELLTKLPKLLKTGIAAPNWKLNEVNGGESISLSELKGKVVLLEFWIKNCSYCIAAVPKLNALAEKYKAKNFQILGINAEDNQSDILSFYERTNPNFKTLIDDQKVTRQYGVNGFPTVVLIDKKRIVSYAINGLELNKLEEALKNALK